MTVFLKNIATTLEHDNISIKLWFSTLTLYVGDIFSLSTLQNIFKNTHYQNVPSTMEGHRKNVSKVFLIKIITFIGGQINL